MPLGSLAGLNSTRSAPTRAPSNVLHDTDGLTHSQPTGFAMRDPGDEPRLEYVEIEAEIHRLLEAERQALAPALHLDELHAEPSRLFPLVPVERPGTDLHQPVGQALLHDPGEGTGVGEAVALELVPQVAMGVEVEDGEAGMVAAEAAKQRVGDRVVATQAQGAEPGRAEAIHRRLDPRPGDLARLALLEGEVSRVGEPARAQIGAGLRPGAAGGRPERLPDRSRRARRRRAGTRSWRRRGRRGARPSVPAKESHHVGPGRVGELQDRRGRSGTARGRAPTARPPPDRPGSAR